MKRSLLGTLVAAAVVALAVVGAARSGTIDLRELDHARTIRSEATRRYAGTQAPRLRVTESSSTGVIESFTLMSADLMEQRILPADHGIYYAICPRGATCPYPARRFARAETDFLSRRLALDLAVHTFLETSADLVAVSLPTRRFVVFVVQRDELAQAVDLAALSTTLNDDPARAPEPSLRGTVDRLTLPRLFVGLGMMPTSSGRESFMGLACWPS